MTKRAKCFYCGDPVIPSRVERDHFPIPECGGGTQTVDACPQCHDLKDRTSWHSLPDQFKAKFLEDFVGMSRESKIVFAQFMRSVFELNFFRKGIEEAGRFALLVCAPPDVTDEQIKEIADRNWPSGTDGGWKVTRCEPN